jgi:hypothetical protein
LGLAFQLLLAERRQDNAENADAFGEGNYLIVPRWTERGPFERNVVQKLDELRPHLALRALMSARLQLERARIASETLADGPPGAGYRRARQGSRR